MTETAKERIYREALEKTRDSIDDFEEQYADKEVYCAFDKLLGLVEKGLKEASEIPSTTDKLKERCDRYENALTEISKMADSGDVTWNENIKAATNPALAAIGGDDE